MSFIDSHAHLADPAFDEDRTEVIQRLKDAGARAVVCIGESVAAARRARETAAAYDGFMYFTAGVHPHDARAFDAERDLGLIAAEVDRGAVAIGECGLDYHDDDSQRREQRVAFSAQLALARDLGKPVVVHTRDAESDTAAMISEAGSVGVRGVLHCFTGSRALADAALAAGWYISFSGIITFKKWTGDPLLRALPSERVLVESDAPYLAPIPHRGRRNEPAWVGLTIAHLAVARGEAAATMAEQTAANAVRLFGLATGTAL